MRGFRCVGRVRQAAYRSRLIEDACEFVWSHTQECYLKLRIRPAEHKIVSADALPSSCIRTTHQPATDFGFLLHKHPDRVHTREFPFGNATVFYPEATDDACIAAVLLDVDPVGIAIASEHWRS